MTHLGQIGAFAKPDVAITLFGDAANAMTPHIAGGMSTGIVGVATFIREWNRGLQSPGMDPATVFAAVSKVYETEHRPLAQELLNRSLEQGGRWSGGITNVETLMEHPKFLWHCADHLGVAIE